MFYKTLVTSDLCINKLLTRLLVEEPITKAYHPYVKKTSKK